jgi:light-regulated signal transduction histidine kinase (bacteriophytochrome)
MCCRMKESVMKVLTRDENKSQGDTSLSRRYSGSGSGRSLVTKFIELHGGRICVETEMK